MPISYRFEKDAEFAATRMDTPDGEPYTYYCVDCEAYHVGIDNGKEYHLNRNSCEGD